MTTRIAGVFVPQVLSAQIAAEMDTRSSNLIRSGAVVNDPLMASIASENKGSKITMPQYASFTAADEVGTDDVSDTLTTRARTAFEVDVPMLRRVINFSAMDLARAEANADPLGDVAIQAAEQIIANQDFIIINALEGVLADNDAQTGATADDMITDITSATNTVGAGNRFQRKTLIDAVAQWGDYGNQASVIVMNSAVYYQLLKDDTTATTRAGEQGFVGTYMGVPIVLEDRSTVVPAVTSGTAVAAKYVSYVMGAGAIGFASLQGSPVLDRNERVGRGWGQETLIIRRTDLVNPRGISFTTASSGTSPNNASDATLKTAASWSRAWKRKNVQIAFIRSNVA